MDNNEATPSQQQPGTSSGGSSRSLPSPQQSQVMNLVCFFFRGQIKYSFELQRKKIIFRDQYCKCSCVEIFEMVKPRS